MNNSQPPHRFAVSSSFTRRLGVVLAVMLVPLALVAAVLIMGRSDATASSHREAPMISKDAYADNTDTYVFISPENPNNLVLVASWIPFEGPEGGPNYYEWDDNVYYDIHVDIDGDATSEVTYTLNSKTVVANGNTFLYNTGTIGSPSDTTWNRRQTYTVTEYFEPGTQPADPGRATDDHIQTLVSNVLAAPVNIGSKSTPNYAALESAATYTVQNKGDTIKIMAGQTDDPFFVDLQVFDLLTLRGQSGPVGYSSGNNIPVDSLSGFNVHTMVVEVPIKRLVRNGEPVLGVWSTSRRVGMTVMGAGADATDAHISQVSRLGMPLVNEVVLPLALKDAFNGLKPEQDLSIYTDPTLGPILQKSVEDPEVGNLLCGLYGVPMPGDTNSDCKTEFTVGDPRSGRGDIFDIFLTGMVLANPFTITTQGGEFGLPAGFNVNRPNKDGNVQPAEMIRINTTISGTLCSPTPSRLGVLGGDACGFPNGRRLADDVVEIELLAVAGAAYEVLDDRDASFSFNPAFINVLNDGVDANDQPFRNTFPYVALAQSGQEHLHTNPVARVFMPFISKVATATGRVAADPTASASGLALVLLLAVPAVVWHRRRNG